MRNANRVQGPGQAVSQHPAFEHIERGVARLLTEYEINGEDFPDPDTIMSGDAATAIVLWVLSHEGASEIASELRKVCSERHANLPNLNDIVYRELGLPRN